MHNFPKSLVVLLALDNFSCLCFLTRPEPKTLLRVGAPIDIYIDAASTVEGRA